MESEYGWCAIDTMSNDRNTAGMEVSKQYKQETGKNPMMNKENFVKAVNELLKTEEQK